VSKAFTRESDDPPERRTRLRARDDLPPGVANYLTADGAARLRAEANALPAADARRAAITELLRTATIVPAPTAPPTEVVFGTTVILRATDGAEWRFRIVGVDEADETRGWLSWRSPFARVLLHATRGAVLTLPFPTGAQKVEVMEIL
jgi:transcription elongation factor GreB